MMPHFDGNRISRWNRHALVALLLGSIFLMISYLYFPDVEFGLEVSRDKWWHAIFHEVGFALLVAVVIWFSFEFFAQNESEELWVKRIERVSRNVFLGVFGKNLPKELIDEATILVIDSPFIRQRMTVTYTLRDSTVTTGNDAPHNIVIVDATAQFRMKNISEKAENYVVQMALPNPLIDEMKRLCKVGKTIIKIDDVEQPISEDEIRCAEEGFRTHLADDKRYNAVYRLKELRVEPQREIEIILHYSMVKEEEDTEIFHAGYPTDGIRIAIFDTSPSKRIVRARSIHRCDLDDHTPENSHGTYSYVLDRYLIPNQGFAIWWKNRPLRSRLPAGGDGAAAVVDER